MSVPGGVYGLVERFDRNREEYRSGRFNETQVRVDWRPLNSKLLEWFICRSATQMRGGCYSCESRFIRNLPIRTIDFSDPEDVERHDRMMGLVERMLALHERLTEARIERERTVIGHQISAADRQIDRLVHELYGLTDEEVRIVEEGTAR